MKTLGDLLAMIERNSDLHWNGAHKMLEDMEIIPFYESSVKEVYVGYSEDYDCSEEHSKLLDDVLLAEGIDSFEFVEG